MTTILEIDRNRNKRLRWKAENAEYERLVQSDPEAAKSIILNWAKSAHAHRELIEDKKAIAYIDAKATQSAERMVPKYRADERKERLRRNSMLLNSSEP